MPVFARISRSSKERHAAEAVAGSSRQRKRVSSKGGNPKKEAVMKSLRRGSVLGSTGLNTMSDLLRKRMSTYVAVAVLATLTTLLAQGNVRAQEESALTLGSEDRRAHIFPTVSKSAELVDIGTGGPALTNTAVL
jgi:hypothetical protein